MAAWFHSWKPIGQALGPTTNRAFWRPLFRRWRSPGVLCCCCRSLSLEWSTVQLVLRLLVGFDVSGGRRSREVRDTRDYRCQPVKQTIDPTAETCQTRGQRLSTLLRGPVSPSWPLWRDWVRGYARRSTGAHGAQDHRSAAALAYTHGLRRQHPRFQTRGVRIAGRRARSETETRPPRRRRGRATQYATPSTRGRE